MGTVNVLFYGPLYEIVGKRREKIDVGDSLSLFELLHLLASKHGTRFRDFVFLGNGSIRSSIAFAVNGDSILESELKSTRCQSVEEFVILPPISGGDSR